MIVPLVGVSLAFVFYVYVIFPLMVFARAWLFPKPWHRAGIEPTVTFVIVCYNEVRHIAEKLDNLLQLDYPAENVTIIVASDGSDDGTNEVVKDYINRQALAKSDVIPSSEAQVQLLAFPRRGKIPALNRAVEAAEGELLVFSDANSQLPTDVLRNLTRHFADESVGCVAGNQVYAADQNSGAAAQGERSYWDFDRLLKLAECRAGNAISATGALYAIRRSLFQPVPSGVTDDFTISTRTILQGYRLIFEPEAIASEAIAGKPRAEYRRKVRVMTRGFRAIWHVRELLDPLRFGFYSIQLASHKLLRRLVVLPLLVLLALCPWMFQVGGWLWGLAASQLVFYGLAAAGGILRGTRFRRFPPFSLPFYFCLVNLAALQAIANVCRGYRIELWDSQRCQPARVSGTPAGEDQPL